MMGWYVRHLSGDGSQRTIDHLLCAAQSIFQSPLIMRESSYCYSMPSQFCHNSVCLSVRLPFVRLSVTRVDQSKVVQASITKSSPSAAWKTLVSGTVKLFHKFKGGHFERGC